MSVCVLLPSAIGRPHKSPLDPHRRCILDEVRLVAIRYIMNECNSWKCCVSFLHVTRYLFKMWHWVFYYMFQKNRWILP